MACRTPYMLQHLGGNAKKFTKKTYEGQPGMQVACNKCMPCRVERARQWSVRCVHEAQMHKANCYLTLTYDDDHIPPDSGLYHRHWQLFCKRLRKNSGPFRYYMCGEYGDDNLRPHYHAIIFGMDFSHTRKAFKKNRHQDQLYRSTQLNDLWEQGYVTIGDCNQMSANYVAGYILKKLTGDQAQEQYERVDTNTGECFQVRPPYNNMSRRPGIGSTWLDKYLTDVYPHDYVVDQKGNLSKPPAYYDKLLEQRDPVKLDGVKKRRLENQNPDDNTLARLDTRGKCLDIAQKRKQPRSIDTSLLLQKNIKVLDKDYHLQQESPKRKNTIHD